MQDISNMTSDEVNALIFKGAGPADPVAMPEWIALQVVELPYLDQRLRDWAWSTLDC